MNQSFGLEGVLKRKGPFFVPSCSQGGKASTPTMCVCVRFESQDINLIFLALNQDQ